MALEQVLWGIDACVWLEKDIMLLWFFFCVLYIIVLNDFFNVFVFKCSVGGEKKILERV